MVNPQSKLEVAIVGGCAGLLILASSSSLLPLQLFWLPPSPPGVV